MRSSQRIVTVILLISGLFFSVMIWGGVLAGIREPRFLEMMFPVVFSLAATLFAIRAFRNSVRLSEQAIELRGLSGIRVLPLDKIKGRRRYLSKGDDDLDELDKTRSKPSNFGLV
jgi:hypothetical protein